MLTSILDDLKKVFSIFLNFAQFQTHLQRKTAPSAVLTIYMECPDLKTGAYYYEKAIDCFHVLGITYLVLGLIYLVLGIIYLRLRYNTSTT